MRISIILMSIFLGSCSLLQPPKVEPSIIITQKIIYPNIPNIREPIKSELESIKFDWPRLDNYYSIKNGKKCKLEFLKIHPDESPLSFRLNIDSSSDELEENGKFWYDCSVRSIDSNSNLYIGLTEIEYKKLVSNTNKLLLREKKWKVLLKSINDILSDWRKRNKEPENSE